MTSRFKTRCPHCQLAFRVSDTQLNAANGMVRCGVCFKAFNGRKHLEGKLVDSPAPEPAGDSSKTAGSAVDKHNSSNKPSGSIWDDGDDFYIDDNFDVTLLEADPLFTPSKQKPKTPADSQAISPTLPSAPGQQPTQPLPAATRPVKKLPPQHSSPAGKHTLVNASVQAAATPGTPKKAPAKELKPQKQQSPPTPTEQEPETEQSFALNTDDMLSWRPESSALIDQNTETTAETPQRRRWPWYSGSALALITLCGQLFYFNSLQIDRGSPLWPGARWLCGHLGCPLQQPDRDSSKIASSNLLIRSHPTTSNALIVDAEIINNHDFSQPFPPLTLVFEDLQGNLVAQRTFQPAEYLQGELTGATLMPSKQPIKLEMELVDPGKDAVSFRLLTKNLQAINPATK